MRPSRVFAACLTSALALACAPPTQPTTEQPEADGNPLPEAAAEPPVETTNTGILSEQDFAALHELTDAKAPAPRGEEIQLAGARAYLSLPPDATGPLPAVVVIHEWWGLNEHIKHWTDRLAADGYAALAVDLYGGQVATDRETALALMKGVDETAAREILAAAHLFLSEDERIKAPKRGVIGWCFGGGWSLQHALQQADLDAAVIYYGMLETDPAVLSSIQAPVMGVFGNQDAGIPPTAVDAFAGAMEDAGKDLTVHRYDAQHAFANPSSGRYNPEAAEQAWAHAREFFGKHLREQ